MIYKGKLLTEIHKAVSYQTPRKMLVWSEDAEDESDVRVEPIMAIVNNYGEYVAISCNFNHYKHCAEIPKNLRLTNRELAEWTAKGNGQVSNFAGETNGNIHTFYSYQKGDDDTLVPDSVKVRKFGDNKFVEPTTEYCTNANNF